MKLKKLLFIFYFLFISLISFSQQIGDGLAPVIPDFTIPLRSGVYNGVNAVGAMPDNSHPWQHLFVMRHPNVDNNHQLQISSSFSSNDRLFFRKIAADLNPSNPVWHEIATRDANTFNGDQIIKGNLFTSGDIVINNSSTVGRLYLSGAQSSHKDYQILNAIYGVSNTGFSIRNDTDGINILAFDGSNNATFYSTVTASNGILIGGTGTAGFLPRFTGTETLGSSNLYNDGSTDGNAAITNPTSTIKRFSLGNAGWASGIQSNNGNLQLLYNGDNIGLTLDSGNVGIGTTSPSAKLDVNGVIQTFNKDNNFATWDNVRIWAEGESSFIESNGDENGLTIRSNTGNKILLMNNVGIGTTSPTAKLETFNNTAGITSFKTVGVNGSLLVDNVGSGENYYNANNFHEFQIGGVSKMRINASGNVGIGTTTPAAKLDIVGDIYIDNLDWSTDNALRIREGSSNSYGAFFKYGLNDLLTIGTRHNDSDYIAFQVPRGSSNVTFNGNVGIGSTNPDQKLTVKGKIHAEEIIVDLAVPADYVFQKYYTGKSTLKSDYVMPTLAEIESFTKKNHHLPNVPSAQEVQQNGVSLGTMSNVLYQTHLLYRPNII